MKMLKWSSVVWSLVLVLDHRKGLYNVSNKNKKNKVHYYLVN